jgi:hypothetical protein
MKNKFSINLIMGSMLTLALAISSCKKDDTDDPKPSNPNELVTTLKAYFTETTTGAIADSVTFRDIDGPGGNAPVQDSLILDANKEYSAIVLVLDESKNPVDTISNEILEEDETHQFIYLSDPASGFMNTTILDDDSNGNPLGLQILVQTFSVGTGSWKITLRHYDSEQDKDDETSNYDSDVEVSFGVRIK